MTIKMEEGDCGGISVIASGAWDAISGSASKVKTKIEAAFSSLIDVI